VCVQPRKRIVMLLTAAGLVSLAAVPLVAGTRDSASAKTFDSSAPQCGHWAILRSCELLGVPIQMETILKLLPPNEGGASMLELREVFRQVGLNAVGKRETLEGLIGGPFPSIAHMGGEYEPHFVTVSAANDECVRLFDGGGRATAMTLPEFENKWTGALLVIRRDDKGLPLQRLANRARKDVPCIEFDRLIIDKADVPWRGKPLVYEFSVRNTGEAPLVIEDIKTDCKCLGAERPTAAIAPGGKGTIVLRYSVEEGQGSFKHEALVKSNDPCLPLVKLTAAGNTDVSVMWTPKRIYFKGVVPGQTRTATVSVHSTSDIPLVIHSVSCESQRVEVTRHVLSRESAHQFTRGVIPRKGSISIVPNTRVLQVAYAAGVQDIGRGRDTVVIHTNIDGFEEISVPVYTEVVPPVGLYPSILVFMDVQPDDTVTETVEVVSRDGSDFEIVSVNAGDSEINHFATPGLAKRKTLSLSAKGANLLSLSDTGLEIDVEVTGALPKRYTLKLPIYVN